MCNNGVTNMSISLKIEKYIEDSKINGKFCKWDKFSVNVFITPITANIFDKNFLYYEIHRAVEVWNITLRKSAININFNIVQSPVNADVIIHWTKVGRVFEGMCKYPSIINSIFKKISIDNLCTIC